MCYGCNGCNRCGKMDRLRRVLNRRLCLACKAEVGKDDQVCPHCGGPLPPIAPPAGTPLKLNGGNS